VDAIVVIQASLVMRGGGERPLRDLVMCEVVVIIEDLQGMMVQWINRQFTK